MRGGYWRSIRPALGGSRGAVWHVLIRLLVSQPLWRVQEQRSVIQAHRDYDVQIQTFASFVPSMIPGIRSTYFCMWLHAAYAVVWEKLG
jgi:hypothetical protein